MTTGSPDREEVMMKLFGDIEAVCFDIMHGEEKKLTQLNDMRQWTKLVLKENEATAILFCLLFFF